MVYGTTVRSHHCCPINALSLRQRVGVRGSKKANALIFHPLIPTFSQWEKGRPCQTFHGLWDNSEVTSLLSHKRPLPQGEGWGEGIKKANALIFHPSSRPSPNGRRGPISDTSCLEAPIRVKNPLSTPSCMNTEQSLWDSSEFRYSGCRGGSFVLESVSGLAWNTHIRLGNG